MFIFRLEPSVPSHLYATEPKPEVGRFPYGNSRIQQRKDRRPSTPSCLPPINPICVINSDRRGTKKTNNEFNLNPCRVLPDINRETTGATTRITKESSKTFNPRHSVLPDIKSQTKAATTSRRTSCRQTIDDCNSPQAEPEPDKLPSLAETAKKYQKNQVYGTSSWRQDVKPIRAKQTTKSATRGNSLVSKRYKEKATKKGRAVPANKSLSGIGEGRESRAQSSLDHILEQLEFDGDVIYRSETQLGEAGSEYNPVIDTPRPASPVDYSFKTLLSLDPNRRVPSRIPVLTGDISKLIPPRAPVYPHPLRYFAGELIEKEYQRAEMLKSAQRPSTNTSACQALSPRRPLDPFEQTMSELKRPSSAYSKLSFKPSHFERASAKPKLEEESVRNQPHLRIIITSRPKMTRTIDTSQADWWIKELEICRQTCQALHKEVPGCTSTVSSSGDLQMTANVDTTNAEQVHTRFLRAMKLYFAKTDQ